MNVPPVIRTQGIAFSVGAWLLILAHTLFLKGDSPAEILVLALVILFLGVPHGALDTLYVRHFFRMHSYWAWAAFALAYVGLAAMVVSVWIATPLIFLVSFLGVSAFHFSGDPVVHTPPIFRVIYGGAVIVFPALLHAQEVTALFSMLAGAEAAAISADALHWTAYPWLLATLLVAARHAKKNVVTSLELLSVSALAIVVSPLLAFSMYFCGMHGLRHILRTRELVEHKSFRHLFHAALPPFLLTLTGAAAGWYFLKDASLDTRVMQLVFVSLAALTVPHMMLVDRSRFFGGLEKFRMAS